MKNSPSIKTNYLLNLAYQMLAVIVPVITTPYVSRILQPDGIGDYSYILSIVSYFSMTAALGVATYGQLCIAKHRDDLQTRSIIFWEIIVGRAVITVLIIAVYFLLEPVLSAGSVLYKVMIINLIAGALDASWFFQGLEQFKVTVLRNVGIRIISTVCIFVFVREKSDLILYACILQGSTLIGNILLLPYLKQYIQAVDFKQIKFYRHWKESLIYFVPTIATSVYTILDKSMIGMITKSSFENGYYEQAHKIEQMLIVVLTSLGSVTLPRLTYLWNQGNKKSLEGMLKRTIEFILCLSFPMMVGVFVVANRLIPLFLGEGYEPCIMLLQIFSILLVVVGLNNTIGKQCLMATGRQNLFNRGVITGACVNFVANLILITYLGAMGAAISSVLAECTILVIFVIYSKDILPTQNLLKGMLRYGILSGVMAVCIWVIGQFLPMSVGGLAFQICAGIVIYLILLLLTKDPFLKMLLDKVKPLHKRV